MAKTILFVTYGSGHARMVIPVIRELEGDADIHMETLALTLAGPMFTSEGLPYLGFRDFVVPEDAAALAWGRAHLHEQHHHDSGIAEEETIAYLGLNYACLLKAQGEDEAARLWKEKSRQAFLPIMVLERVIDRVKPDLVVTTNSPRAERAAVEVANTRGIPTLSMVDLMGIQHFHALEARTITVLMAPAIDHMLAEGVTRPREAFHITGNPAFDRTLDYVGPRDVAWRSEHFPHLPAHAKTLLWIDVSAYWNMETKVFHIRSEAEIWRDLSMAAEAAKTQGAYLLVRPHPTQQRDVFLRWLDGCGYSHVFLAGDVPLYPLLRDVDVVASYNSTVTLEALLMHRQVVMLKYYDAMHDLPLGEWGLAWLAHNAAEFAECVKQALCDEKEADSKRALAAKILNQERSAPKVAALIRKILATDGGGGLA